MERLIPSKRILKFSRNLHSDIHFLVFLGPSDLALLQVVFLNLEDSIFCSLSASKWLSANIFWTRMTFSIGIEAHKVDNHSRGRQKKSIWWASPFSFMDGLQSQWWMYQIKLSLQFDFARHLQKWFIYIRKSFKCRKGNKVSLSKNQLS